jgi:hypothetical protein
VDASIVVVLGVLGAGCLLADATVGRGEVTLVERLLADLAWGPAIVAGLLSLTGFASLAVGLGQAGRGTLLAALAVAGLVAAAKRRSRPPLDASPPRSSAASDRDALLSWTAVVAVTAGYGWSFLRWLSQRPLGSWDGMGIWTYRALQWFRAGDAFPSTIGLLVESKPGYPLLVPGLVTAELTLWGAETTVIPVATGWFWVLAAAAATALAVARRAPAAVAPAAAALLLSTPMVWNAAFGQGADLAVAALAVVAALGLGDLVVGDRPASAPAWLIGLVLGLMVWTKNEGAILASLLVVVAAAVARGRLTRRPRWTDWLGLAIGAVPGIAATVVLKTLWATSGEVERYLAPDLWSRLADPSRWQTVAGAFASRLVPWNGEALWGGTLVLLGGLAALAVVRRPAGGAAVAAALFGAPVLLSLAIDAGIYLITPEPLEWHLRTSLDRLGLQLLPLAVVAVLGGLVVSDPEPRTPKAGSGVP